MLAVSQTLGSLAVGESAQLTLTYQVSPTLLTNTMITNIVTISSSTKELNSSDNVAIVTNTVILPLVNFDRPNYVVNEGDGSAVITLTLNHPPFVTVTVSVVSQDNTATAAQDYRAISQTVKFKPGQTLITMNVPITNDTLDEVNETVTLRWQNPRGALAGLTNPVTLTIVDNDEAVITPPVVVVYTPSITITLSTTPQLAKVGQVITYNYRITNTGNISLSSVIGHWLLVTGKLSLGELSIGQSVTGTFSYTVRASDFPAPIVMTMQVSGTGGITITTATATSKVELMRNVADLSLSKVASANPAAVNGVLTYTLMITNNGPNLASEVILTDALPSGMTLLSRPTTCAGQTALTCTLGLLAPNMTRTVIITVKPTITGSITNTARVYSPDFDPKATNNVATATKNIGWLELKLGMTVTAEKFVATNTVLVGSRVTYTLWVTNVGTLTASQVVLTDTMPVTMSQFLAASGLCNNQLPLICQLSNLGPHSSISKTLVVLATSQGVLTNTAQLLAPGIGQVISDTITLKVVKRQIYLPLLQKSRPPVIKRHIYLPLLQKDRSTFETPQ